MAACVAPLFSQRPDIHHWLYHYTQLGVSKFHMYVPNLHAHEATHYDEPHEVSSPVVRPFTAWTFVRADMLFLPQKRADRRSLP